MAKDVLRRKVNLARLAEPLNLTLTRKPANRSGFKVVRSDETEETEMLDLDRKPARMRRRAGMNPPRTATATPRSVPLSAHDLARTKRRDAGLLNLILPSGATKDDAMDVIENFGLSDDYEIVQNDDGRIYLHRRDAENVEQTIPIQLNDGIVAEVDAQLLAPTQRSDEEGDGCLLARIDFDGRKFSDTKVGKWLDHFGVDYIENGVEAVDGGYIVSRTDEIEDKDCHKIRLADGIVGYVARGEANNIPQKISRAVIDESFGKFGFGHLDFASALADPEFSQRSESAIFQLNDVLHNIVFRSELPLDDRKQLISRATAQFNTFMGNLMDKLPSVVVENMKVDRADSRQRSAAVGTPGPSGGEAGPGGGQMPLTATDGGMNSSFDDSWRQGDAAPPSAGASGDVYATITGGTTLEREDGSEASVGAKGNQGLALTLPSERAENAGDRAAAVSGTGTGAEGQQAPAAHAAGAAGGSGGDQATGAGAATARSGEAEEIGALVARAVSAAIAPLGEAMSKQQGHFDERLNDIQARVVKSGENTRRLSRSVREIENTVQAIGEETVLRDDESDDSYDGDDSGMNGADDDGSLFSGALGRNFDTGRHQ